MDRRAIEVGLFWNSLELPWQCALDEAWQALCAGSLPIGAAIVGPDGVILARGRNRIFETAGAAGALYGHKLAHAEMNALLALDHASVDPRDCALYTTTEPCPLCAGAIRVYNLPEVHYASRDSAAGSAVLFGASPYMRRLPMRILGPADPDLEAVIVALHFELRLRWADPRVQWVLDTWTETVPRAAALAQALFASGALPRMCAEEAPAGVVVDYAAAVLRGP